MHPLGRCEDHEKGDTYYTDEIEVEEEDNDDLYSIEMVNGEHVFVCNLCDEGFDNDDVMTSHMKVSHNREIQDKEFIPCENGKCNDCIECIYKRWED